MADQQPADRLAEIRARADERHRLERHQPIDVHAAIDGAVVEDSPLVGRICAGCSDEDTVAALEYGDLISLSAGVRWPCPPDDIDWLLAEVDRLRGHAEEARAVADALPADAGELTNHIRDAIVTRWAGRPPAEVSAPPVAQECAEIAAEIALAVIEEVDADTAQAAQVVHESVVKRLNAEIGELRTEIRRLAARKWTLADLPDDAARIRDHLTAHGLDTPHGQVLCVVEEAGKLAAAYRRWAGLARRPGPWSDVVAELADVVLSAAVLAARLDINLTQAIADKIGVVNTRGWREPSDDTGPDEGTCPDALPGEGGER